MRKTTLVVAFLVAAVLAGLFVSYKSGGLPLAVTEDFMQKPIGRPVGGPGMGPYDSVSLDGSVTGWASNEPGATVHGPLPSDSSSGDLMYLVGNRVDSSCCPSAFTTDTGCVCLSESDKSFMAKRAGNRA